MRNSERAIKKQLFQVLESDNWVEGFKGLLDDPESRLISSLFASLYNSSALIKWRGVSAFGLLAEHLAESDLAKVRNIMRRCIWMLTEESGGIAWGAPEVMGEIMASNKKMADEFQHLLAAYIYENDFEPEIFLEFDPLRRGVFWGLARLAVVQPELVNTSADLLMLRIKEETEPEILGIMCWLFGLIRLNGTINFLNERSADDREIELFRDREIINIKISDLAKEALSKISS